MVLRKGTDPDIFHRGLENRREHKWKLLEENSKFFAHKQCDGLTKH